MCPSLGLEVPEEEKTWEEHQEQLEKEMQEARRMVFHLQVRPAPRGGGISPFEDINHYSSVLDTDLEINTPRLVLFSS